ncbi:MAG: hypothetical protein KBA33_05960 [Cloacibacterium sp.]|jgi:hypothetical protein|nr:hypothetical protein [Cloacibacterium sp.]
MKKIVFTLSIAIVATSCGMPEGGNKGVIKKEEGVVRYDDANAEKPTHQVKEVVDSTKKVVENKEVEKPTKPEEKK